jgi:hypothetical protein
MITHVKAKQKCEEPHLKVFHESREELLKTTVPPHLLANDQRFWASILNKIINIDAMNDQLVPPISMGWF